MVTKKNAKKTPPKTAKVANTKAAATRQAAGLKRAPKKQLLKTPAEQAFYCNDGRLFYDLKELAGAIDKDEATTYVVARLDYYE